MVLTKSRLPAVWVNYITMGREGGNEGLKYGERNVH